MVGMKAYSHTGPFADKIEDPRYKSLSRYTDTDCETSALSVKSDYQKEQSSSINCLLANVNFWSYLDMMSEYHWTSACL